MTRTNTPSLENITDILVEQLGVNAEDVKPESTLYGDLGADSLDCVELVMAFEEEYAIDISDAEVDTLERQAGPNGITVQQCVDFLEASVTSEYRA